MDRDQRWAASRETLSAMAVILMAVPEARMMGVRKELLNPWWEARHLLNGVAAAAVAARPPVLSRPA